jgi:REP element-mobilizing transposase RayT
MGRQLSFLRKLQCQTARTEHGGEVRVGRRKLIRPFDARRPLHVVLRSSRARGAWSLRGRPNERIVRTTMRRYPARYGVKVYEAATARNHIHMLLRSKCRLALQNFLRTFAGVTARLITGARKGRSVGTFWDYLAYSRIVQWGRDFAGVRAYVIQNELETLGGVPHRQRAPRRQPRTERRRE